MLLRTSLSFGMKKNHMTCTWAKLGVMCLNRKLKGTMSRMYRNRINVTVYDIKSKTPCYFIMEKLCLSQK